MKAARDVLVLGHRGMLGSMAVRYFSSRPNWRPHTFGPRCRFDEQRLRAWCWTWPQAVIINCIGAIPQKKPSADRLYEVNSDIPRAIRAALGSENILVHPSTDCVFGGTDFGYGEFDTPNPVDDYGRSKAQGDANVEGLTTITIRTSIIGPDGKHGLMGWLLTQKKKWVPGYIDHRWNGITTLEWCRVAEELIKGRQFGLHHVCCRYSVTKAQLLHEIAKVYRPGLEIVSVKAPGGPIDRTLACRPSMIRASIGVQLRALKAFTAGRV